MTDLLFATVKAVDTDEGPGEFLAVLSTKALDRDGEVVAPDAFGDLPVSVPIYFEHNWKSGAAPVGRGEPFRVGDEIHIKAKYASTPEGQNIRTLVTEGIVDSMSVGFLNGKREVKSGVKTVVSAEMFEGSLTAIPINTGARVLASKSYGDQLMTFAEIRAKEGDRKAIDGSWEQRSEALYDALSGMYPAAEWVERIATFDDRIVYKVHGAGDPAEFQCTYTFDGTEVTLGTPEAVEVTETITVTTLSLTDETAGAAAKAAAPAVEFDQAKAIAADRLRMTAG